MLVLSLGGKHNTDQAHTMCNVSSQSDERTLCARIDDHCYFVPQSHQTASPPAPNVYDFFSWLNALYQPHGWTLSGIAFFLTGPLHAAPL